MINFVFIKSTDLEKDVRLAVHRSGKLGFAKEAEIKLDLATHKAVSFAKNADEPNDKNLYMFLHSNVPEGSYKINKAGEYYSVNTSILFDNIGVEYKNGMMAFDMQKMEQDGKIFFKLKPVKKERKSEKQKNETP